MTREESYQFNSPDYVNIAKDLRKYADSLGIVCNQSHAPFPSSTGKEEEDKVIFDKTGTITKGNFVIKEIISKLENIDLVRNIETEENVGETETTTGEKAIFSPVFSYTFFFL